MEDLLCINHCNESLSAFLTLTKDKLKASLGMQVFARKFFSCKKHFTSFRPEIKDTFELCFLTEAESRNYRNSEEKRVQSLVALSQTC